MILKRSHPLLLTGEVLGASVAIAASPAPAQQTGASAQALANCALGVAADCEATFSISSAAKQAAPSWAIASTTGYDAYVIAKEKQQTGLARTVEQAAANGIQASLEFYEAASR